ncbi:jg15219 [Pararge aegeria aegeria]|uniref:Jg15219 protein n=1 Tax=Pararge aegeria aegeria TaxID=348720 RepID=A0A8S4QLC8_9NEOP|nr:jg15219 [Pararge aegeria aegeria]
MTVSNYRPISLLKVLSKVLEKVVNNRLLSYLENHNLISNNQYGFRTKKSTEDAVICLSNIATKHMDQRLKCLAVFLDLKKAFDTVSIPLLLRKMECLGIRGTPLAWFKDYLKGRSQTVKVLDYTSNTQKVTHGIPQGSTLGPTLFLIYANEMCDLELDNAQIIAFADDTAIIFHGGTWEETRKTAEKGLAKIRKTLENNLLTINAQKTKYICFSITPATQPPTNFTLKLHSLQCTTLEFPPNDCSCAILDKESSMRYLGVIIDENLNWHPHITALSNRVRRLIPVFRNLRDIVDNKLITLVYKALCQSLLIYCISAWGGAATTHMTEESTNPPWASTVDYPFSSWEETHAIWRVVLGFDMMMIMKR